jgi:hypothetical protein
MTNQRFASILLAGVAVAFSPVGTAEAADKAKPNIVFILADDKDNTSEHLLRMR